MTVHLDDVTIYSERYSAATAVEGEARKLSRLFIIAL
jgi:hypothetical protein